MNRPRNPEQVGPTPPRHEVLAAIAVIAESPDRAAEAAAQDESLTRRAEVAALLATFPDSEHDAARTGLYLNAEGRLATRHRLLRAL